MYLFIDSRSVPEVIKLFPCSTPLSKKFILLINVKMPTIVGILTFISMINTTTERLKAKNFFICRYFSFYEIKFYNLGTLARTQDFGTFWVGKQTRLRQATSVTVTIGPVKQKKKLV